MIKGFIFDVDGVLVDSPHERAWGDTLQSLLETRWPEVIEQTGYRPDQYTSAVYQQHVAGKPRTEGAAALLAYFDVHDPDGERCRLLCDEKQEMIVRLIDDGKFRAFDDALRFLLRAKCAGARLAAASSSKNANRMMAKVDLSPFGEICPGAAPGMLVGAFDANVCGRDFARGKPHPEIFLTAGELLGLPAGDCVVIEDAPSGVQAAKAAGMACIGIARADDAALLKSSGADWVVTSLDALDPAELTR